MRKTVTRQELAKRLDGRGIGDEITKEEAAAAKKDGILVIYGASDDLCELHGAIYDEIGGPGDIYVTREGKLLPEIVGDDEDVLLRHGVLGVVSDTRNGSIKITACWCAEKNGPDWTYETAYPHSTFDIMEDGAVYCRGLVIDLKEPLRT